MDKVIGAEWVSALRSGDFIQGKGALHPGASHCCLGVLCELYIKRTGLGKWLSEEGTPTLFLIDGDSAADASREMQDGFLPRVIQKWAGLHSISGINRNGEKSLASANDKGSTFQDIADLIEQSMETL